MSSLERTSQTPSEAMTTWRSYGCSVCRSTSGSALTVAFIALFPNARVTASTPHTRSTSSCTIVPPFACRPSVPSEPEGHTARRARRCPHKSMCKACARSFHGEAEEGRLMAAELKHAGTRGRGTDD